LGSREGGEEGRKLLEDAIAAFRSALEVHTKAGLPQDCAQTQNNLERGAWGPGWPDGKRGGRQTDSWRASQTKSLPAAGGDSRNTHGI
jgi:hypothetical protein